jgi:long-chain acyl-CoA synthetase
MVEQLSGEFDPNRHQTLLEILQHAVELYGDKPAYTCFSCTLSYREVDRLSDCFARFLQAHTSLKEGDRIALQLPNLLQFPVAMYGALKAGLIVVNTNPLYTSREMRHQFKDAGVRGIVILSSFCDKLETIIGDTELEEIIVAELGDLQSPLRRMMLNLGARYIKKLVPAYSLSSATGFAAALKKGGNSDQQLSLPLGKGDDAAVILYTGGTTGYAKGVTLSHNNLIANMMQFRVRCLEIISDGKESIAAPLPLYHSYAFLLHCIAMPYAGNHNHLIPNPRDLDSVISILRRNRITGFVGINTLYLGLLQKEEINSIDFSAMRFCGAGGMPLTRSVAEEWEQLVGCPVFEGYGLTECSPIVSVNSPSHNKPGTVGLPMVGTEVKVVDDDGGELAIGETGELWIRGPQVMHGYWQREQESREVLTEDGWFKSGDFVQQDDEGYIRIVDRKKDMILVSGFNVIPGEIEDYVNSREDILESAAIGVPDEHSGEAVVLYAVRKRGSTLTEEQLRDFCREGLTAYKVPRHIHFTDDLPKSNIGKVLRRELREQHAACT